MRDDIDDAGDHGITYRAFRIDGRGRIYGVEVLAAANDADAVTLAETLARDHGLELWERGRFILRLPACGPADAMAWAGRPNSRQSRPSGQAESSP